MAIVSDCDGRAAFTYIIVGGGTAGCALASRLKCLEPTSSFVLLQRCPNQRNHPLVMSPLGVARLAETGLRSDYHTFPQAQLDNPTLKNWGGNVLSGSSAVKSGLRSCGHVVDYDL